VARKSLRLNVFEKGEPLAKLDGASNFVPE
jgi:hypothetical protein